MATGGQQHRPYGSRPSQAGGKCSMKPHGRGNGLGNGHGHAHGNLGANGGLVGGAPNHLNTMHRSV